LIVLVDPHVKWQEIFGNSIRSGKKGRSENLC
jgi:hypothetical protein